MDEEEKKTVEEPIKNSTETTTERKGFNITALILGIISLVSFCAWYISLPTGIIAIIFSIAGRKDAGRGMGVAGMVMGIIGVILTILWVVVLAGLILALNEADPSLLNSAYYY